MEIYRKEILDARANELVLKYKTGYINYSDFMQNMNSVFEELLDKMFEDNGKEFDFTFPKFKLLVESTKYVWKTINKNTQNPVGKSQWDYFYATYLSKYKNKYFPTYSNKPDSEELIYDEWESFHKIKIIRRLFKKYKTGKVNYECFFKDMNEIFLQWVKEEISYCKESGFDFTMANYYSKIHKLQKLWKTINKNIQNPVGEPQWKYFFATRICEFRDELFPPEDKSDPINKEYVV